MLAFENQFDHQREPEYRTEVTEKGSFSNLDVFRLNEVLTPKFIYKKLRIRAGGQH